MTGTQGILWRGCDRRGYYGGSVTGTQGVLWRGCDRNPGGTQNIARIQSWRWIELSALKYAVFYSQIDVTYQCLLINIKCVEMSKYIPLITQ